MPEFLYVTPRSAYGPPFFIRLPNADEGSAADLVGDIVNEDGSVIERRWRMSRRDVKKAQRAILEELPSGRTVLVPVGG